MPDVLLQVLPVVSREVRAIHIQKRLHLDGHVRLQLLQVIVQGRVINSTVVCVVQSLAKFKGPMFCRGWVPCP